MTGPNLYMHIRRFAQDVASILSQAAARGEWIPFELIEEPAGSCVLYSYRSMIADYIGSKWEEISSLESYKLASGTLTSCKSLDHYLKEFGKDGVAKAGVAREGEALAIFITRIWRDSSSMDLSDGRFETAYAELEEFGITGAKSADEAGDDGVWLESPDVEALSQVLERLEVVDPELKRTFLQSASPLLKLRLQRCDRQPVHRQVNQIFEAGVCEDHPPMVSETEWAGGQPSELVVPIKQQAQAVSRNGAPELSVIYEDSEDAGDYSAPV